MINRFPLLLTTRFPRALVIAGISLAASTGCHVEVDGSEDTPAEEAATGRVASALQVTTYDLLVNAPGAFWSNNDGGIAWGTNDARGAALKATGILENGVTTPYLHTKPKAAWGGFMRGAYSVNVPPASAHPKVTATFGFVQGASGTDGVTFALTTKVLGVDVAIFSQTKSYTGGLSTVTADLSAFGGQTIQLFVKAEAGWSGDYDWAAWTDLRVTADSSTPPTDCTIAGVQYAKNDVNPAYSCQICDPNTSASAWTTKADSCLIGNQCYAANALDTLGCRRCDPLVSQTSWTTKASCDNLIVAATNATEDGDFGGVSQADAKCASEGANLGLPGTWKAMISKNGVRDYKDAIPPVFGSTPVVNLQGTQLYSTWNSMFTNQVWPSGVSMYKFGSSSTSLVGGATTDKVWTGTGLNGQWAPSTVDNNCNGWTDIWRFLWITPRNAIAGDFSQRKIVNGGEQNCNNWNRFACVLVPPAPVITTQNYDGSALGDVMGKAQGDSYAFLGIPFAAPPTGSLRFAPPAKAVAWSGVRNAFTQPASCAQSPILPGGAMVGSEDCLYLNVWTPKSATPTSNLPVLVYHYGGGHIFGGVSGAGDWLAQGLYDGDRLAAAQNAVVVTIQSRHGALGYLADPALSANATSRTSTVGGGTSGNYGLLDVVQALKWVKKNISRFGGDSSHTLFFGESSGATLACDLLASPLSKDTSDNKPYFSSMIMQSGFCEEPTLSQRYTQDATYMQQVGCDTAADKVTCLRNLPVEALAGLNGDLLAFFPQLYSSSPLTPEAGFGLKFGPNIDGYVLPAQPRQMFAAGTHNKVPVITGSNKDEVNFFMLFMVGGILTGDLTNFVVISSCSDYATRIKANLGLTVGTQVTSMYGCNSADILSPTLAYSTAFTHAQYECPQRRTLRALSQGQTQPTRRYWFTHGADNIGVLQNVIGLIPQVGAAHTFDVPFIFNTHNTLLGYWPSAREEALGVAMQRYWRAFAASGDPNYAGGVSWPAYVVANDNTLKLEVTGKSGSSDPGIQVVNGVDTDKCDFWDVNHTLDGWY